MGGVLAVFDARNLMFFYGIWQISIGGSEIFATFFLVSGYDSAVWWYFIWIPGEDPAGSGISCPGYKEHACQ